MRKAFTIAVAALLLLELTCVGVLAGAKTTIEVWHRFNPGEPMDDWINLATAEFEKAYPDIDVKLYGQGRQVISLARPRLIEGNPPDVLETHQPEVVRLVQEGLVYPLDKAMATKAYDQDCSWKDTFMPLVYEIAKIDGVQYGAPYYYTTAGFFYNVDMFKKLNLRTPATWEEFVDLCQKLKKAGIEPISVDADEQYLGWWFIMTSVRLLGDEYVLDTMLNKPGTTWTNPGYLEAAKRVQYLAKNFFMSGFQGSVWPAAQVDWVNGTTAMIYCGSWLPDEMSNTMPEGFHTDLFRFPGIGGGKGDPTALELWTNSWFIPRDAKHKEEATKYLKFMVSKKMAEKMPARTLAPIKGTAVHKDLASVPRLISEAKRLIDLRDGATTLAPEWEVQVFDPVNQELLYSILTPEEFIKKLDAAHKRFYGNK